MIEGLRSVGILKMKTFVMGTRMFMYIETNDDFEPARDFQAYADASPRESTCYRGERKCPQSMLTD